MTGYFRGLPRRVRSSINKSTPNALRQFKFLPRTEQITRNRALCLKGYNYKGAWMYGTPAVEPYA